MEYQLELSEVYQNDYFCQAEIARMVNTSFEERLLNAFDGSNLKEIAAKMSVNYHTLRNWAKETRDIPPAELKKIAIMTNVSLNWLLIGEGDKYLLGNLKEFDLERAVETSDDWLGVIDEWYEFEGLQNPMPEAMGASFMGGWAAMDRGQRLNAIRDFKNFLDLTFETKKGK